MANSAFNPGGGGGGNVALHYKNIKTDFGAVGNGTIDDNAAFIAFNTWARAQTGTVWLVMPPGIYNLATGGFPSQLCFSGIKRLVIDGYGAQFNSSSKPNITTTAIWATLTGATSNNINNRALINSAAVGDTTVTLITPADASKFAVGTWAGLCAFDMQGDGSPPNFYYFEYNYITAIDSVGGVITFASPLSNFYSSGYPNPHPSVFTGGPAYLYVINQDWDQEVLIRGIYFNQGVQVSGGARRIVLQDCKGSAVGIAASQSRSYKMVNCNTGGTMEVDKDIELMEFENCFSDDALGSGTISFQSASIEKCLMNNCRFKKVNGTPKRLVARNTSIGTLQISPAGYGVSKSILLENCFVGSLAANVSGFISVPPANVANGVITLPKYPTTASAFHPGSIWCSQCPSGTIAPCTFAVLNVRTDGTNTITDTTLDGAFSAPTFSGNYRFFRHPGPNFTAHGCYGCTDISNQSRAPDEQPVYQYSRRLIVTNQVVGLTGGASTLWGKLVKYRVNVIRPYTGPAAACKLLLGASGAGGVAVDGVTLVNWNPQVNLKVAGERVFTLTGTTGLQAGDVDPAFTYFWFRSGFTHWITGDTTADTLEKQAVVDVEIITDQGLPDIENILFGSVAAYPGL
jgi:hypothetical protein